MLCGILMVGDALLNTDHGRKEDDPAKVIRGLSVIEKSYPDTTDGWLKAIKLYAYSEFAVISVGSTIKDSTYINGVKQNIENLQYKLNGLLTENVNNQAELDSISFVLKSQVFKIDSFYNVTYNYTYDHSQSISNVVGSIIQIQQ